MAVVIRLARQGAKHRDFWRMVVADARSPRDGRFIEQVGWYDPLTKPATVQVKADRVQYWIQAGARPSDKVRALLRRSSAMREGRAVVAEAAGSPTAPSAPAAPAAPAASPAPETDAASGSESGA